MTDNHKNIKFSLIVCYNRGELFDQLVKSISQTQTACYEIIGIDNRAGKYNLPQALNRGRQQATGRIHLCCHQDILFPPCWLDGLLEQLKLVEDKDEQWGVLGVMGLRANGLYTGSIIDPHTRSRMGDLPQEVISLDEVCLIVRKDSDLCFDENLGGFHFYGADICLQARQAGLKCYAIDAPFEHLSGGKVDASFWEMAAKLKEKWATVHGSPAAIETTCGVFRLKSGIIADFVHRYQLLRRKFARRIQGRHRKPGNQ